MTATATRSKRKGKKAAQRKPLGTIWEVPDPLWQRILPLLQAFWPTKASGRHHADWRQALNGIIFRMRSGCQWEQLPRKFGPKSTVHDWFQRWCSGGVMHRLWEELAKECDALGAVDWQWQAADGRLGKARFGGKKGGEKPHGSWQKRLQGKRAG
jgi:putative transposase